MASAKYRVYVLSLLLILSQVTLFAGTTGKIAGRVTDKATGEPLIGATVMVEGTRLGAVTDIDGHYAVLNVPPGMQTIKISMIGYKTMSVSEVRVHIDETSPLDVAMEEQALEGETITVVAQRNIIKQDVSTSVTAVQPEEISNLPITSITDVVSLQAGVEEGLMIRGGASDQLLFQIDGVTLRDPRNNRPIASVALSSIQEVSIEKGGFNAEYGQVRSGIINIIAREGDVAKYYGAVNLKYSPATQKHFGISVYDPNSMWNKPYLDPAVCWTGTDNGVWDTYTQRQYPKFEGWNKISERLLSDNDPTNDLSPAAAQKVWEWERRRRPMIEPDYNIDASFGGPVPYISQSLGNLRFFSSFRYEREMLLIPLSRPDYREYTFSIKVNSDISDNMRLMVNSSMGKSYNVAMNKDDTQFSNSAWGINGVQFWNPTDYVRSPYSIAEITNEQRPSRIFTDSWYSTADVGYLTFSGKLTTFFNSSTYLDVSIENINRNYETGPIQARDTTKRYEVVPGYFVDEAPFGFSSSPFTGLTGMFYGGHSSTARDSTKLSSFLLKADLTSQVNKENLIKAGIEFSIYDLNLDYGSINTFFSDINYVKERWSPYRFSAYVQDKIEMYGFIANLGVRMDVSNPNTTWVNVDAFNKSYFSSQYVTMSDSDFPTEKAKVDIAFSPRLGISHPITENSKLYFNYGHFKEMPAYEEIFRIGRAGSGELRNFGNPNLAQAKTVSYELGYDHSLFGSYLLQIAAFYNDITNQQGYTQYISDRLGVGYFLANNNGYQDTRGLEITFRKTEGAWLRGFVNYTYQISTFGAFGKQIINEEPSQQKLLDQNTALLYQQKPVPQPRANASLTFLTPKEFGPEVFGFQPFSDWTVNLLAVWNAGQYMTYNPVGLRDVVNNVQVTTIITISISKFLRRSISNR